MECQSRHHALLAKKWGGGATAPPAPRLRRACNKTLKSVTLKASSSPVYGPLDCPLCKPQDAKRHKIAKKSGNIFSAY